MDLKSLTSSTVIVVGLGMIAVGLAAPVAGFHSGVAVAPALLGLALVLGNAVNRIGRAKQEKVPVRIRRSDR